MGDATPTSVGYKELHARAAALHRQAENLFATHADHEREQGRLGSAEKAERQAERERQLAEKAESARDGASASPS